MLFLTKKDGVLNFLKEVGAESTPHIKDKSLRAHLIRVHKILTTWECTESVQYAGLCHSLYSTEFFKTALLTVDRRPELQKLIGEEAEELVYLFCSIKRDTLERVNDDVYSFASHISNERITLTKQKTSQILHILLANEVDHLHSFNVHAMSTHLTRRYLPYSTLLSAKPREYLEQIALHPSLRTPTGVPFVRFIAHAGVEVSTRESSVVIDPWLYPSVRERGKLQGLDPTSYSIDFLIPEPWATVPEIDADIILLSHFHSHHAPLQEVTEFAQRKPIHVVCPPLSPEKLKIIENVMGSSTFGNITFHFITEDTTLTLRDVEIRVLTHIKKDHLAYLVKTKAGSVFHLSDPIASISNSLNFDPAWDKFNGLNPDFAFMSCAGHASRNVLDSGERVIRENGTFSPTQAAKFSVKIGAKRAGAVGIFNHSVWTDRIEFSRSASESEREFQWALSFLSPATRVLTLRPGDIHYFDTV